jgi:hypothetical protein
MKVKEGEGGRIGEERRSERLVRLKWQGGERDSIEWE